MTEGWLIKQIHVYYSKFTLNHFLKCKNLNRKTRFKKQNNKDEYNLHFKCIIMYFVIIQRHKSNFLLFQKQPHN